MPLSHLEYGSLASSEELNDNFEYLDNRITTVAENLTSTSSSFYSNVANINSSFSQQNSEMASDIDSLGDALETLRDDFDSQNNAPDYSHGIGIVLPYTVESDGYVYAGVNGLDFHRYVYVNGKKVHGHCGYGGGKEVYSGSLFRVSVGDVVSVDLAMDEYYFYPMKGV